MINSSPDVRDKAIQLILANLIMSGPELGLHRTELLDFCRDLFKLTDGQLASSVLASKECLCQRYLWQGILRRN